MGDVTNRRTRVECTPYPSDKTLAYFFCDDKYVVVKVNPGGTDTIVSGPRDISSGWPSLKEAQFANGIDTILPNPDVQDEMYFFSDENYVRINAKPGTTDDFIVNGPATIRGGWPSLDKAGFKTVDAALLSPDNKHHAYFFSGTQYVRIQFQPGQTNDTIINGPSVITDYWPSLKKAGFETVDMILPHPDVANQAYFFSGDQYALIEVKPGTAGDTIIRGPRDVRSGWPSLHEAKFY